METIALYVVAATLGSMVFFAAGIAPTVFQSLPEAEAGQFLRRLFPRYYLALILGQGSQGSALPQLRHWLPRSVSLSPALLVGCGKFWCRALTNSATLSSVAMPTPDSSLLACIDGRSVSIWFNCWHC